MHDLLTVVAEGEGAVNYLDAVMENIPKAFELANKCVEAIFANPLLTLFFSISMIGTGFAIFRKMKRTAKA